MHRELLTLSTQNMPSYLIISNSKPKRNTDETDQWCQRLSYDMCDILNFDNEKTQKKVKLSQASNFE